MLLISVALLLFFMRPSRDEVQPPENSLIVMADVDEISSRATMKLLKACTAPLPVHLQMQNYIYSFEWVTGARSWRAQVHSYGENFSYIHGKASDVAIADAGWHCRYVAAIAGCGPERRVL